MNDVERKYLRAMSLVGGGVMPIDTCEREHPFDAKMRIEAEAERRDEQRRGRYTETKWKLDDAVVTIGGFVKGDEVRCFAAEDADHRPIRIPDAFMPDALQDLIDADRQRTVSP